MKLKKKSERLVSLTELFGIINGSTSERYISEIDSSLLTHKISTKNSEHTKSVVGLCRNSILSFVNTNRMVCVKVLVFTLVVAVAVATPIQYAAPQYGGPAQYAPRPVYVEEPYEERNYKVYYSVKDDPSYNYQTRNEEKNGKTVTGQYTVLEPTGELRVVNYIADDYGFRADVQNQGGYGSAPAQAYKAHQAPARGY